MTVQTPIWVCAYANNQWGLTENITEDPKKSIFTKAIRVASHRMVSILDEGGETFRRIWCGFELNLTFNAAADEVCVVYTDYKHEYNHYRGYIGEECQAVGIVLGGAPIDHNAFYTAARKHYLLFKLNPH